jgi:hypothetical protein
MGTLPEPDDVDFVVSGGDSGPESLRETAEFIERYKRRPEYRSEVERAKAILDSLGIDPTTYGMDDPLALLDHWRRCVEDLARDHPPDRVIPDERGANRLEEPIQPGPASLLNETAPSD